MTEAGWTRNAPTKEGWYWWKYTGEPSVVKVVRSMYGLVIDGHVGLVSCMNANWLGPITPDSYQQGRVACLGDVKRYVERQIKIGEDFIGGPDPNIQRRVALDEVIEYCDRQLAQQAQDEK